MNWIDISIAVIPFLAVLWAAVHARKYIRGVVDFLAAGRVAGRYVICVGDLATGLSVIGLVSMCEARYRSGMAQGYWDMIWTPIAMVLSLSGFCLYRYRATNALSIGQFLEMRYSRSLRVVASGLRSIAEMISNSLGPAIAANFFIYYLGLPHHIMICGINLPCFVILTGVCLTLAMIIILPAGRVSLIITDTLQGLIMYPVFVILLGYLVLHFGWDSDMLPVLVNRVPGESFMNPFDVFALRDFNMFALGVAIFNNILNYGSWYGNDTTGCARSPHEQKMAAVLGTWRGGLSGVFTLILSVLVITIMNHERFLRPGGSFSAHDTRVALMKQVADEVAGTDVSLRDTLCDAADSVKPFELRTPTFGEDGEASFTGRDGKPLELVRDLSPKELRARFSNFGDFWGDDGTPNPKGLSARELKALPNASIFLLPDGRVNPLEKNFAAVDPAQDSRFSHDWNIETEYLGAVRTALDATLPPELAAEQARIDEAASRGETVLPSEALSAAKGGINAKMQQFRTVYGQMMMPVSFRRLLPVGLTGLFLFLMIMLFVSTDDSRIMNASCTIAQDCVVPLLKRPPTPKRHLALLRASAVFVCLFFFTVAIFFTQKDFLSMFTQIMLAIWGGGAGPMILLGLYTRFGNTAGAWASMICGSGTSLMGLYLQRCWQTSVIPFLERSGWAESVRTFLAEVSSPFNPWIDWSTKDMNAFAEKFPVNSFEVLGLALIVSLVTYIAVSLIARHVFRVPDCDLDRILHRGAYAPAGQANPSATAETKSRRTWYTPVVNIVRRIVGITPEYTVGDKVLAWSVFVNTIVLEMGILFFGSWLWHGIRPQSARWWGGYFWFRYILLAGIIGVATTVWFLWGGIRDMRRLFRDLSTRVDHPEDNGRVEK